jgi:hypothetical protein
MGLDKFSSLGSFEEMAEQNEQSEVKTPATPATEPVTTDEGITAEAVEAEIAPVTDGVSVSPADNVETPKNN